VSGHIVPPPPLRWHPSAVAVLSLQYRMAADVMAIANRLVYHGAMRCGARRPPARQGHRLGGAGVVWLTARVIFSSELFDERFVMTPSLPITARRSPDFTLAHPPPVSTPQFPPPSEKPWALGTIILIVPCYPLLCVPIPLLYTFPGHAFLCHSFHFSFPCFFISFHFPLFHSFHCTVISLSICIVVSNVIYRGTISWNNLAGALRPGLFFLR